MNYSTSKYPSKDNEELFYYYWKANSKVANKGVIQLSHGIGEHAGRYNRIATILQEQGFDVYGNDHRAHGKSVKSKKLLGVYKGENYFDDAVEDMRHLTLIIKKEHPNKKIILFGHSMGSLLSRKYVTKYGDDLDALILSGTASYMKGLGFIGITTAKVTCAINGRVRENDFLNSLVFGEFNRKFKPNRTKFDWLSRDEKIVDLFDNDPDRAENFSLGVFLDIIKASKQINSKPIYKATPKNLPIYLFSGDKDPVGEMGKGVKKISKQYKKAGVKDLTLKLYKDGRHEMLNEINKEEVEQDLLNWLNSKINGKQ